MIDGTFENSAINLYKEFVQWDSIVSILKKYNVKQDIDFFSEDTDYADYWIVESILTEYKPKVLAHEINQQPPELCVTVPKENRLIIWDGSNYHGGSVCAFHCLAKKNGYSMVYCESKGVNCFWVRNDLIKDNLKFNVELLQETLNPKLLLKKPSFNYPPTTKSWTEVTC